MQAGLFEHANREPHQHFLFRAPAHSMIDVPQSALPEIRESETRVCFTGISVCAQISPMQLIVRRTESTGRPGGSVVQ